MKLSNIPLRVSTGAYILNAGVTLLQETERGEMVHKTAASTYKPLGDVLTPEQFRLALGGAETAVGAALLLPFVKPRTAGLALLAFSGGLVGMYAENERFRRSARDPRPSHEGESLAKDFWLVGIALALVTGRSGSRKKKKATASSGD